MDLASVLTLVLLALFLAVQPWSVLAGVLLVTASGGSRKELAYVAGWVAALSTVAVATVLAYPDVPASSRDGEGHAVVELAAGLFLAAWLLMRWRHPKDAGTGSQPSWLGRLDTMSPLLAFGLGAFLPTYAVVVAAVSDMLASGLSQGGLLALAVAWVLLASTGVAAPLVVRVTKGHRAPETYERWRVWIVANSRRVLFAAGGLVSLVLVGKGLVSLLS